MFAVVGNNNLLFSMELTALDPAATEKSYQYQFILYASLDSLDLKDQNAFRDCIDTSEQNSISAYVTAGQTAFLLLHPKKKSDLIKKFFKQIHTAYAELLMNPFYQVGSPIEDDKFKKAVADSVSIIVG
ncbi:hypothetical protein TVAG_136560 [Trichomonas vaginalis G3]|uniref:Uncharacterized protein n=1 Tax=Trichomonas vaginalis (strain ATCC PRA-98 / G3) TaxID=412133 RepID=A2DJD8_TRIV3|nr:ER to Golgi vesicle-mediated transport [Trichomonas vaginalis G3]EAY19525.1 hypothetical protein TVAG_136560 [Trichomonas vaginalis G3]KAI5519993.1 ER to Golgi vesicle-mediated transport [Trichomonas vaginalis G3]|eukprot:XP_001580511.1 hypothetical protein [Trichomonas vaginalis G3]